MDSLPPLQGPKPPPRMGPSTPSQASQVEAGPQESLQIGGRETGVRRPEFGHIPLEKFDPTQWVTTLTSRLTGMAAGHVGHCIGLIGNPLLQPSMHRSPDEQKVRVMAAMDFIADTDRAAMKMKAAGLRDILKVKPDLRADDIHAASHLMNTAQSSQEKLVRMDSLVKICRANPDITSDQIDAVTEFANRGQTPDEQSLRVWGARRMYELNPGMDGESFQKATEYVEGGPSLSARDDRMTNVLHALRLNPSLTGRQIEGLGRMLSSGAPKDQAATAWSLVRSAPAALAYA